MAASNPQPFIYLKKLTDVEINKYLREATTTHDTLYSSVVTSTSTQRTCPYCEKIFHRYYLPTHKLRCQQIKSFSCNMCGSSFCAKYELERHIVSHTKEKVIPCQICSARIPTLVNLYNHEKTHFTNTLYKPFNLTYADYKKDKSRPIKFQCATCDSKGNFKFISAHARLLPCLTCKKCSAQFSNIPALEKHCSPSSLTQECPICKKNVESECKYVRHLESHLSPHFGTDGACCLCGLVRKSHSSKIAHLKTHDQTGSLNFENSAVLKDTRYKCGECNKKFTTKMSLALHNKRMHLKVTDKIFLVCFICQKKFFSRGEFNGHVKRHLREHWHKCNICGVKKVSKEDLKRHMIVHLKTKTHKCNQCGKTFGLADNLRRHVRCVHEKGNKSCAVCGKVFPDNSYLKDHMMKHNKEKEFECGFCEKKFQHRPNMYRHIRESHRNHPKCENSRF